jgi:hypothetical protein
LHSGLPFESKRRFFDKFYQSYLKELNSMDQLVKLVSEKTGLSEEMSRKAVEVVLDYLKDKLPAPIGGQIDGLLEGSEGAGGLEDLAKKGLGGLFG